MFTPGSVTLVFNQVSGASTDTAPAVAAGEAGSGYPYFLIWKPKGQSSLSFVPVGGQTAGQTVGQTFTLPQVQTNLAPGASDSFSTTSGFGSQIFDNLTLAFVTENGDVWQGVWSVVPDAAPFPGAGTDFGRTPDEGSNNYIFYKSTDCQLLKKIAVTIVVTEDLDCPKGFAFQLNANSATNASNFSRCEWQQCAFDLDSQGHLTSWVNNWVNTNNGPSSIDTIGQKDSNEQLKNLLHTWDKPTIPQGCTLKIALNYGKDDVTVTSATFSVVFPEGGGTKSNSIDYASNLAFTPPPGVVAADYLAPISVVQLVIVGEDNKADADFKSGAGTISVSAADPLIAGDSRPSCADTSATLEQSNILYGVLSATPSSNLTQVFCASASKN
jgi:hypothetical protein